MKPIWSWGGSYIGYRLADALYSSDGKQIGYFAEGDELYGCDGHYLGEIRSTDRLIFNPRKKLWFRQVITPAMQRSLPGQGDVTGKPLPPNWEDFPHLLN